MGLDRPTCISENPPMLHCGTMTEADATLKIGTFNTRTLKSEWREAMLLKMASEEKLDLISIQEHKMHNKKKVENKEMEDGWLFIFTRHVGVLVSRRIRESVNVTYLSNRLLRVELELKVQKIHFFVCYAPTDTKKHNALRRSFFGSLKTEVMQSINSNNMTFALADFNAPLQPQHGNSSDPMFHDPDIFVKKENENTTLLKELLKDAEMVITEFANPDFDQQVTFAGYKKPKAGRGGRPYGKTAFGQIDHILSQQNCTIRNYCTMPRWKFNSDHKLVSCEIELTDQIKLPSTQRTNYHGFESKEKRLKKLTTHCLKYNKDKKEADIVAKQTLRETVMWRKERIQEQMKQYIEIMRRREEMEKEYYHRFLQLKNETQMKKAEEDFQKRKKEDDEHVKRYEKILEQTLEEEFKLTIEVIQLSRLVQKLRKSRTVDWREKSESELSAAAKKFFQRRATAVEKDLDKLSKMIKDFFEDQKTQTKRRLSAATKKVLDEAADSVSNKLSASKQTVINLVFSFRSVERISNELSLVAEKIRSELSRAAEEVHEKILTVARSIHNEQHATATNDVIQNLSEAARRFFSELTETNKKISDELIEAAKVLSDESIDRNYFDSTSEEGTVTNST